MYLLYPSTWYNHLLFIIYLLLTRNYSESVILMNVTYSKNVSYMTTAPAYFTIDFSRYKNHESYKIRSV